MVGEGLHAGQITNEILSHKPWAWLADVRRRHPHHFPLWVWRSEWGLRAVVGGGAASAGSQRGPVPSSAGLEVRLVLVAPSHRPGVEAWSPPSRRPPRSCSSPFPVCEHVILSATQCEDKDYHHHLQNPEDGDLRSSPTLSSRVLCLCLVT